MEMIITSRPIECQVSLIGSEIRIIVEVLVNQVSIGYEFINYGIGASLGKAPMHGFDQEDPAGG
jgi:hypothetical protein